MHRTLGKTAVLLLIVASLSACGAPAAPVSPSAATEAPTVEAAATVAPTADAAAPTAAGLRTFVIDPAASTASYLANEEFFGGALEKFGIPAGLNDVVGSTQEIAGQLQLNLDDLAAALGDNSFTVKMNTFTTDQPFRDNWIREQGPRFNDFPLATFIATAIEGAPASYTDGQEVTFKLVGDLTVREIAQPATFDVTAKLAGDTLTGTATTRFKLSGFGIEPPSFANTLTVADEFGIEVKFTARAK